MSDNNNRDYGVVEDNIRVNSGEENEPSWTRWYDMPVPKDSEEMGFEKIVDVDPNHFELPTNEISEILEEVRHLSNLYNMRNKDELPDKIDIPEESETWENSIDITEIQREIQTISDKTEKEAEAKFAEVAGEREEQHSPYEQYESSVKHEKKSEQSVEEGNEKTDRCEDAKARFDYVLEPVHKREENPDESLIFEINPLRNSNGVQYNEQDAKNEREVKNEQNKEITTEIKLDNRPITEPLKMEMSSTTNKTVKKEKNERGLNREKKFDTNMLRPVAQTTKRERIASLDILRGLATMLVVWLHNLDKVYAFKPEVMNELSMAERMFANFGHVLGRIAVPIFLMLTGYLLLDKKFRNSEDVFAFWKKRLVPLLICQAFWTVVYDGVGSYLLGFNVTKKNPITLLRFFKHMFGIEKQSYSLLFYLTIIGGIYFALPFVAMVVQKLSFKIMWIPMVLVYLLTDGVFIVNLLAGFFNRTDLELSVRWHTDFLGGYYGIYLLLGYYVKKEFVPKIKADNAKKPVVLFCAFYSIMLYVFTALFQSWTYNYIKEGESFMVQYNFPTLPFLALSNFLFVVLAFENVKRVRFLSAVSRASFGIYVLHYLLMLIGAKYTKELSAFFFGNVNTTLIFFIFNFLITFLIVSIIGKIPVVGKGIFLYKNK